MRSNQDDIERFYEWLKVHPIHVIVIVIILVNLIALLSQIPFWIGGIEVNYGVNDVMILFGSIIGACATFYLGIIAYMQNYKLNKINTKLMNLQNQSMIPVVEVSDYKVTFGDINIYIEDDKKINVSQETNMTTFSTAIKATINLYYDISKEISNTTFEIKVKNITSNLIKKITIAKIRTNIFESGIESTQREFIVSDEYNINSTEEFIKQDGEYPLVFQIRTNKENGKNLMNTNFNKFEVDLELESLNSKHNETIKMELWGDVFKVKYAFEAQ